MKISRFFETALLTSCLSTQLLALETKISSKRAPIQQLLPGAYGNLNLEHHWGYKGGVSKDEKVRADVKYKLGSTFYEGKLDTSVTFGVKKHPNSSTVERKSTDIKINYTALKSGPFELSTYTTFSTPYTTSEGKKKGTKGLIGINIPVAQEFSTRAGVFTAGAEYDLSGVFSSKPQTAKVSAESVVEASEEERLGLTQSEKENEIYTADTKSLGLGQKGSAKIGFAPSVVKGLSFEYKLARKLVKTPKQTLIENSESEELTLERENGSLFGKPTNYSGKTTHRLRARYDITNTVYFMNDVTFKQERSEENERIYSNVFTIGAKLL